MEEREGEIVREREEDEKEGVREIEGERESERT